MRLDLVTGNDAGMQPGKFIEPAHRLVSISVFMISISYFHMVPSTLPSQVEVLSRAELYGYIANV